jgi:hypothetical protein
VAGRSWSLPGLDVAVSVEPEAVVSEGGLTKVRFPVGTAALTLDLS